MNPLRLTDAAVQKVKNILSEQNLSLSSTFLRVGIASHSCAGINYSFKLDQNEYPETDEKFKQNELTIVYDKNQTNVLKGTLIDYHEEETKRGFLFTNPLKILGVNCSSGSSCCGGGGSCSSK